MLNILELNLTLHYRLFSHPTGILFKNGDIRVQYLDGLVTMMRDAGILEHFFDKWRSAQNMKEHVEIVEEALVLEHLLIPIIVWSVALVLSGSVFAREVWFREQHC